MSADDALPEFRLAARAPCVLLEPVVWTRTHRDAAAIQRAYRPEERAAPKAGRGEAATAEEALLREVGARSGKWSSDDDVALREAYVQARPAAPARPPRVCQHAHTCVSTRTLAAFNGGDSLGCGVPTRR